jgi:hypothetical protein
MLDPVTGVITAPHYWYEIGINQGTDHSFSRSYRVVAFLSPAMAVLTVTGSTYA